MSDLAGPLSGAFVAGVSFGVSYFGLSLQADDGQEFVLSSGADVHFGIGESEVDFRDSGNCGALTKLLEARLVDIEIDDDARSGAITFDNGERVRVSWPDKLYDNLLLVRREYGGESWVIG